MQFNKIYCKSHKQQSMDQDFQRNYAKYCKPYEGHKYQNGSPWDFDRGQSLQPMVPKKEQEWYYHFELKCSDCHATKMLSCPGYQSVGRCIEEYTCGKKECTPIKIVLQCIHCGLNMKHFFPPGKNEQDYLAKMMPRLCESCMEKHPALFERIEIQTLVWNTDVELARLQKKYM